MKKIMQIIAKETNGQSYESFKYSYDSMGVPRLEYDDNKDAKIQWEYKGETSNITKYVNLKGQADNLIKTGAKSIFRFFLDGSRHVYKVDDISYNKQVYPVVAGQVGIGCCKREDMIVKPFMFDKKYLIVLPDKADKNGWDTTGEFAKITSKINTTSGLKKIDFQLDEILEYKTAKVSDSKLEDIAIARIQDYMIEHEKGMVLDLVKGNYLDQDKYLIKDGSLEYSIKSSIKDFKSLEKIKKNYQWVIGVSKSFNPESCKDLKGKSNADYIAKLPLYCRTPVAKFKNPDFLGNTVFAVWYVRIRDRKHTLTPFDGVIKVEKILMEDEEDDGLDSDLVDIITAHLINERNPTCYGVDKRWANHLYPVYLTESYVKSKYLSTEMFLNLF